MAMEATTTTTTTTTTYSCKECQTPLNLTTNNLYPPDFYFEACNKNTLSFSQVDPDKLKFEPRDVIRPFFETLNYWGFQRKETKIKCGNCGKLVGFVYGDGPVSDEFGSRRFYFGPSQVVPRYPRFRFKIKALLVNT